MSAEAEVRALLLADAELVALVPATRISVDLVGPSAPRPYIVITKEATATERGLDGSKHASKTTLKLLCVGESRAESIAVAEQVELTLEEAGEPSDERTGGFDEEIGAEVEIVTLEWWDAN